MQWRLRSGHFPARIGNISKQTYGTAMFTIFVTILPVFLMILAGYAARKGGIMPEGSGMLLTRFVTWIPLPALMFHIVATTDWHAVWDSDFVIASVGGSMVAFAIGMALGRIRGLPFVDIAVDGLNASYSNAAYVGLPLFLLVLGPQSAPYVVVAATLTLMTLFACAVIAIELGHHREQGALHALWKTVLGIVRNPVMIAPLLGFLWWTTGLDLAAPVERFAAMLGGAASPAALVAIGLFLAERPVAEAIRNRSVLALTAAKLILHPMITAIIAYPLLRMDIFPAAMAIAIAALPTGTGPFMVAGFYARDGKVTSGTVLVTTLLSTLTLTMILALIAH